MQELPLNGFYEAETKKLSGRTCVNWVPTVSDSGSLSRLSLMPSSGIEFDDGYVTDWIASFDFNATNDEAEITGQIHTGIEFFRAYAQFHVGTAIVGVGPIGSPRVKELPVTIYSGGATVAGRSNYSRFATNGTDLVSVAPSNLNNFFDRVYSYDEDLNPTSLDIADALNEENAGIADIAYFGGRFLYMSTILGKVFYSRIGDILPDALDFFAPASNTEKLTKMEVMNDRLYLFTQTTTYLYSVSANVDIPFQYVGSIQVGIDNSVFNNCVCEYQGSIAFFGKQKGGDPKIYMMSGTSFKEISTKDIDRVIKGDREFTSIVRLFSFAEKGRSFLCVKSSDFCFVYEASTGIWHERKTYGSDTWKFNGYIGSFRFMVGDGFKKTSGNKAFIGSGFVDDSIGTELKSTLNEQNESGIVNREVITSPFNGKNDRIIVHELQPQCSVNYEQIDSGWPKPEISISVSYDFGNTFEQERGLSMGLIGDYKAKTRFFSFGYVDQAFTVKIRTMNPYPTGLVSLLARTEKGSF